MMTQQEYAKMQCHIRDKIEKLQNLLEKNEKEYASCLGCNKVFHINFIHDYFCPMCNEKRTNK